MLSKNKILKEVDLYDPLKHWLEDQGFEVYTEVELPFSYRKVDVVAHKKDPLDILWCFEMKVAANKRLLQQCSHLFLETSDVWAVVGRHPSKRMVEIFKLYGIGMIVITGRNVEVIQRPSSISNKNKIHHPIRERFIKSLNKEQHKGIAGLPVLAGSGPAQGCWERVKAYRKENPKASWKELFEKIPNHYASYRSFQSSMSKVVERSLRK